MGKAFRKYSRESRHISSAYDDMVGGAEAWGMGKKGGGRGGRAVSDSAKSSKR